MADNGKISTDPTIAWDDVGGAAIQRVKPVWGVDGAAVDASATNPLPVTATLIAGQAAITGGAGAVASGSPRVTLGSDDPAVMSLGLLADAIGTPLDVLSVIPGTAATNLGKAVDAVAGASDVGVAPLYIRDDALSALTPVEGDWVPGRVNANGAQWTIETGGWDAATDSVALGSVAGQGLSWAQFIDLDETEDEVASGARTVHDLIITNVSAGIRYIKVYDGIASGVTVGSTTPKWTIALPIGHGFVWHSDIGLACATGITLAATTGVAVADTGAPGANDVVANIGYK